MRSAKAKSLVASVLRWSYAHLHQPRSLAVEVPKEAVPSFVDGKEGVRVTDFSLERIRNFCIVAHVDHGKSTLADRLMELTGAIRRGQKPQYLDKLQVERERGITVKAQTVSLVYKYRDVDYLLNLIDTPGHVDFSYEVSRSLAACQGAILLVDATQGIQAQTVANFYMAFEQGLDILPVINKIDMETADPDKVSHQLEDAFGLNEQETLLISAKTGKNVHQVLDSVIEVISPPNGDVNGKLRVLLFDAYHDEYRGVICLVEIIDGSLREGMRVTSAATQQSYDVLEVGVLSPEAVKSRQLLTGQVGYVITGMKTTRSAQIGDTWHLHNDSVKALPGFQSIKANVFSGLYPTNTDDYDQLQSVHLAFQGCCIVWTLGNGSIDFERRERDDSSRAQCSFGRLSQEYGMEVIVTTPTVPYKITLATGEESMIENPCDFPIGQKVVCVQEPTVKATIVAPEAFTGPIMELCTSRRGMMEEHTHLAGNRVLFRYIIGLAALAENFFSDLKSLTKGYASLDYQEGDYRKADLQRLDLIVNGKSVDAFARIVHKDSVARVGRQLCQKLKDLMERQQFEIAIQASSNNRIVCRENLSALRKNVLSKCYGGDITRKKKLLEKQKEGKKRMKSIGVVTVPQEAFHEIVRLN